jgi:serine/threonine protein kinase
VDAATSTSTSGNSERTDLLGLALDGRYRVLRQIGVGGTGIVFAGQCLRTRAQVAIKTLRPTLIQHIDLGTRLRREVEVSRRVLHPGVLRCLGDGTLGDGSPYVVMPLLRGESLARLLMRQPELPVNMVLVIASRIASILHSVHSAGYVHRDVKPEHIMLSGGEQAELRVHLLDFGVCSSAFAPDEEKKRESGRVFGTPSYVSPEQASGEVKIDGRADLFGLGVVMFEALSGCLPFAGASVTKLLLRIIREEAPRLATVMEQVDTAVDGIVAELLAREPARRTASARTLSRALLPYAAERQRGERRLLTLLREVETGSESQATVERTAADVDRYRVA